MRKIYLIMSVSLLILSSCTTSTNNQESMKNYESYIDAITKNKGVESKDLPFDYKLNVYKQKDDTYQYELLISNPRVAMYNIQALALNADIDSNINIHPCLGLLGEDSLEMFNLVPYQSNPNANFYKGFSLEGVSQKEQFTLQVMITWKDRTLLKDERVFFNVHFALEADDQANGKKTTSNKGEE